MSNNVNKSQQSMASVNVVRNELRELANSLIFKGKQTKEY